MKGGNELTKEELGQLILSSERQLYATAKTILADDQDCADAIQESIVKAFTKIHTLKKDRYAKTDQLYRLEAGQRCSAGIL